MILELLISAFMFKDEYGARENMLAYEAIFMIS